MEQELNQTNTSTTAQSQSDIDKLASSFFGGESEANNVPVNEVKADETNAAPIDVTTKAEPEKKDTSDTPLPNSELKTNLGFDTWGDAKKQFEELKTLKETASTKEEIKFAISDLLDIELINAPEKVRELLYKYSSDKFERIELTEEAIKLADTYISEKVVGRTSVEDCRHIALATINKVDVLASWNFKHIVNLDRIKGYNSVNLRLGYQMIEIRSPKDLINYGND